MLSVLWCHVVSCQLRPVVISCPEKRKRENEKEASVFVTLIIIDTRVENIQICVLRISQETNLVNMLRFGSFEQKINPSES